VDQTTDESSPDKPEIGMVVIRGNSIVLVEALERIQ
jgi:small nuclear ribonucleoprotein (snRNP)-like protein